MYTYLTIVFLPLVLCVLRILKDKPRFQFNFNFAIQISLQFKRPRESGQFKAQSLSSEWSQFQLYVPIIKTSVSRHLYHHFAGRRIRCRAEALTTPVLMDLSCNGTICPTEPGGRVCLSGMLPWSGRRFLKFTEDKTPHKLMSCNMEERESITTCETIEMEGVGNRY